MSAGCAGTRAESVANGPARRFHEKAGFGAVQDFAVGGATLPEPRYRYDG